ncbi:MAG: DUF305 domain-containing protein [Candidatus Paceibacterota bacterium]
MQNKNNTPIYIALSLIGGLLIGFLIWHKSPTAVPAMSSNSMHTMPDGSMMGNNRSDMTSMMSSMNADLQGKTGDTFDQAFLSEMIVHHQGAIDMAKLAQTNAKHQEIKDLAGNIITAQTKEIAEMKAWQKSWYNQ